jgi:lysophospholipase L1-like esterase
MPFQLVSLLVGVNNQYRGHSVVQYRREFAQLPRRAIELAGGRASRVVVLSVPDWGVTPFAAQRDRAAIGAEIDRLKAINRDESERLRARYVDITAISREAADDSSLLAADGLHPSATMYRRWAKQTLAQARAVIALAGSYHHTYSLVQSDD